MYQVEQLDTTPQTAHIWLMADLETCWTAFLSTDFMQKHFSLEELVLIQWLLKKVREKAKRTMEQFCLYTTSTQRHERGNSFGKSHFYGHNF